MAPERIENEISVTSLVGTGHATRQRRADGRISENQRLHSMGATPAPPTGTAPLGAEEAGAKDQDAVISWLGAPRQDAATGMRSSAAPGLGAEVGDECRCSHVHMDAMYTSLS